MDLLTQYSDDELLQEVVCGSENAFTELYQRYKNKLYSFAFHLTGSEEEAKDLVQDVFCKIWSVRASLAGKQVFVGYLYKMIRNFSIDHLRRFSKENLIINQLSDTSQEAAPFPADSMVLYKEVESKITQSINRLPSRQREIYIMHRNEGRKYSEIASELGLSTSTVENHFSRALENLRKSLDMDYETCIVLSILFLLTFS